MESFLLAAANTLIGFVATVFNIFFFWLPVDPLADYLDSGSVQSAAGQGLSWLNWFVDVGTFAAVLSTFVTILLLFAAYKVLKLVFDLIVQLVQAVKPF